MFDHKKLCTVMCLFFITSIHFHFFVWKSHKSEHIYEFEFGHRWSSARAVLQERVCCKCKLCHCPSLLSPITPLLRYNCYLPLIITTTIKTTTIIINTSIPQEGAGPSRRLRCLCPPGRRGEGCREQTNVQVTIIVIIMVKAMMLIIMATIMMMMLTKILSLVIDWSEIIAATHGNPHWYYWLP